MSQESLVSKRIYARKVLIATRYMIFFQKEHVLRTHVLQEILNIDRQIQGNQQEDQKEDFVAQIQHKVDTNIVDQAHEIAEYFFPNIDRAEIDWDYIALLAGGFEGAVDIVQNAVNQHTTSFSFEQMDLLERILFVLAYLEHSLLGTPKEILLNEVVELAKRYADDGAAKLLNGILHKILV